MATSPQNRASRRPQGRLIGYARLSTDEQATEVQEMELSTVGCSGIVQDPRLPVLLEPGLEENLFAVLLVMALSHSEVRAPGKSGNAAAHHR